MYYCCLGCCEGCKGCSKSCEKSCVGLNRACSRFSKLLNKVFDRPFSLCLFLTVLFIAMPAVIFTIVALANVRDLIDNCDKPQLVWILIACGTLLVDTAFCVYMFFVFNRKPKEGEKPMTTFEKIVHFFCKDCIVLFFGVYLIVEFAWIIVGIVWTASDNSECKEQVAFTMTWLVIILMGLFYSFGVFGACFAFCFLSCNQGNFTCTELFYFVMGIISFGIINNPNPNKAG